MGSDTDWARKGSPPPPDRKTSWTRVRRAQGTSPGAKKARWALVKTYRDVICWAAGSVARQVHDALDCAGDVMLLILEGVFLRGADPTRGRLVAYLVKAVRNYTLKKRRDEHLDRVCGLGDRALVAPEARQDEALDAPVVRGILAEARRATEERLQGHPALPVFRRWIGDPARTERGMQEKMAAEMELLIGRFRYLLKKAMGIYREEVLRRSGGQREA